MYLRYFMWNFSGRQNDIQGHGGMLHGNWISGIKFLDEASWARLDKLPDKFKNHPARNTYFMLPAPAWDHRYVLSLSTSTRKISSS